MRRIMVGVDGSAGSDQALRWAANVALAFDAEILAVSACSPTQAEVTPDEVAALTTERAQSLRDRWIRTVTHLGVPTCSEVGFGDPRELILEWAEKFDVDLVVVGSGGAGGRPGFLHLGSVAEYLAHHCDHPLAVVPTDATGTTKNIALGIDGSDRGRPAVQFAAMLASRAGATVTAIAVEEPFVEWTSASSPRNWRRTTESLIKTTWARPVVDAGAHLDAVAVRDLHPAEGLLRTATEREADLIVVGMRGTGSMSRLRVGGTAIQVLHHASLPVVLVPANWAPR